MITTWVGENSVTHGRGKLRLEQRGSEFFLLYRADRLRELPLTWQSMFLLCSRSSSLHVRFCLFVTPIVAVDLFALHLWTVVAVADRMCSPRSVASLG